MREILELVFVGFKRDNVAFWRVLYQIVMKREGKRNAGFGGES